MRQRRCQTKCYKYCIHHVPMHQHHTVQLPPQMESSLNRTTGAARNGIEEQRKTQHSIAQLKSQFVNIWSLEWIVQFRSLIEMPKTQSTWQKWKANEFKADRHVLVIFIRFVAGYYFSSLRVFFCGRKSKTQFLWFHSMYLVYFVFHLYMHFPNRLQHRRPLT